MSKKEWRRWESDRFRFPILCDGGEKVYSESDKNRLEVWCRDCLNKKVCFDKANWKVE